MNGMDRTHLGFHLAPSDLEGFTTGAIGELNDPNGRLGGTPFTARIEGTWQPPLAWRVRTDGDITVAEYRTLDGDSRIVEGTALVEAPVTGTGIVHRQLTPAVRIELNYDPIQAADHG